MTERSKTAALLNDKIRVCFPSNDYITLKKIASIRGAKYNIDDDSYKIPLTRRNVKLLEKEKFVFSRALHNWNLEEKQAIEMQRLTISEMPGLPSPLYPYQKIGVQFIEDREGRALIADEMGLGKTIQALAWCRLHPEHRPVIVVVPSIVKYNWEREILKWVPDARVEVLEGQTPYAFDGNFIVINYDILWHWRKELKWVDWSIMILDEGHFIKNDTAQRTKAFKQIMKPIPHLIILTGTPIENKPIELFNAVSAIDPAVFPDYVNFTIEYCDAKVGKYGGWDVKGSSNTTKLNKKLKETVMLRRKKSEVLTDLPPKIIATMPLELSNRDEYKQAEDAFIEFLKDRFERDLVSEEKIMEDLRQYAKRHKLDVEDELSENDIDTIKRVKVEKAEKSPVLVQMSALKRLAVEGKMKSTIKWIAEFLESGEKLVVFAVNRKVIRELMKAFPDAVKIDGSVAQNKRQGIVDKFQNDPKCRLFIGNMKAAGVGITLTAASNVAMVQYPWSPAELAQAADRVHRITQTKQVTIWNLVGINTIEEKILEALAIKERVIDEVLDGGKYEEVTIAREVLRLYNRKLAA